MTFDHKNEGPLNAPGEGAFRRSFTVRDFFRNKINYLSIPVLIYTIYMLTAMLIHTFADADIPNEYREAANVLLTKAFLDGGTPYALSAFSGETPCFIYLYGPLYSMVTALLSFLVPVDLILLHYLVTLVCMLVSAWAGARIVRRYTKSVTAPAAAFLFLLVCHWRYSFVNAVPDSMGIMLMMLTLLVLSSETFRYKPIVCASLTAAAFFAKQYFLLIAGTAFLYFLIYERKNALRYARDGILIALALALVISLKSPLFWTYTLYLAKGPGDGVGSKVTSEGARISSNLYNFRQIMSLGGLFLPLFIAETAGVIVSFVKKKLSRIDLLLLLHLAVSGICLTGYLGKNGGAWLSYYLELFAPALVLSSIIMLEKFLPEGELALPRKTAVFLFLFYLFFLGFTCLRIEQRLPKTPESAENYADWAEAERIIREHSDGDTYLYPHLAYFGLEEGQYVYNSGQPFVVSEKFYRRYRESERDQKLFPHAETVFTSHLSYREAVRERVRRGEYSLLTYVPDYPADEIFNAEDLSLHYRKLSTLTLRTGRELWETEFWVPK